MNSRDLRKILLPLNPLYGAGVSVRNFGYDRGIIKSKKLPVPVLSVGNISVGGSGKTPFTIYLISKLLELGRKPAVLSRGYKRSGDEIAISCPSAGFEVDVRSLGDEPALISQTFSSVPVGVHTDRYNAGLQVLRNFPVDVFILDDGFQNRELHRDIDFVLMNNLLSDLRDRYLPAGNLRDSKRRLRQASLVVVTAHEPFGLHETDFSLVRKFAEAPVAGLSFMVSHLTDLSASVLAPDFLKDKEVTAFCGIAGPESFYRSVQKMNYKVVGFKKFRDHHWYEEYDIDEIFGGNDDVVAVTTAKDAARIFLDQELSSLEDVKRIYALHEKAIVNFGEEHIDAILSGVFGGVYA